MKEEFEAIQAENAKLKEQLRKFNQMEKNKKEKNTISVIWRNKFVQLLVILGIVFLATSIKGTEKTEYAVAGFIRDSGKDIGAMLDEQSKIVDKGKELINSMEEEEISEGYLKEPEIKSEILKKFEEFLDTT